MALAMTVQLLPHGDPDDIRSLGSLFIVNDGTGDEDRGNYRYVIQDHQGKREGQVFGYKRSEGFWDLIQICLEGDESRR